MLSELKVYIQRLKSSGIYPNLIRLSPYDLETLKEDIDPKNPTLRNDLVEGVIIEEGWEVHKGTLHVVLSL